MRTSITLLASLLAYSVSPIAAQYTQQTSPFYLVLYSTNSTLNGSTLSACHEGAAIEGLCLSPPLPSTEAGTYTFNYSSQATPDPNLGFSGILAFNLPVGTLNVSEPMGLSYNPTSNVAVPLFSPSNNGETTVGFDQDGKLYIAGWLDDTVAPTKENQTTYYRWYVCTTSVGYTYQTLAWVMGNQAPENPTCQKVDVKRVYV